MDSFVQNEPIRVLLPLEQGQLDGLRAGQMVLFDGPLLGARDAAHRRMVSALNAGDSLPVDLGGETIYYVGPCPAPAGWACGSAGPTTSGRMDPYTPVLLAQGLAGMIGKGRRSAEVMEAMRKAGAVYFAGIGGAGALYARSIRKAEVLAYPDLGPEALYRLVVADFPAVVAFDRHQGDIYSTGPGAFRRR